MLTNTTAFALLPILLQVQAVSHHGKSVVDPEPVARVQILAFEANGRFLGRPNVSAFESADHRNLAGRFRDGVATVIPYGVYRAEARLPGYFSDVKYVRVYQAKATVVMGLRFGQELPQIPPSLSGQLIGLATPPEKTFVKLVGVYENVSIDSAISNDGKFEIGGLSPGKFVLFVVCENGILASRSLTIPYTGPPMEIELDQNVKH